MGRPARRPSAVGLAAVVSCRRRGWSPPVSGRPASALQGGRRRGGGEILLARLSASPLGSSGVWREEQARGVPGSPWGVSVRGDREWTPGRTGPSTSLVQGGSPRPGALARPRPWALPRPADRGPVTADPAAAGASWKSTTQMTLCSRSSERKPCISR